MSYSQASLPPKMPQLHDAQARDLRQLRLASIFEGMTLLALLGIAVPLKHITGLPQAVSLAGPVHGFAFLAYLWVVMNVGSGANWKAGEFARVLAAAVVPFGFLSTLHFIRQRQNAATAAP